MSLQYLSMSQLAEITRIDRRTVAKHLADFKPQRTEKNAHLYYAPIAIPFLLEKKGQEVNWSELIVRCLNSGDLVVNPIKALFSQGNSNEQN